MTVEEIAARLGELLEEERGAIRVLDGKTVERIAEEKTALLAGLSAASQAELARGEKALKALVVLLRRNAILLVHARDSLRDVLHAARGTGPVALAGHPLRQALQPGARLSRKF